MSKGSLCCVCAAPLTWDITPFCKLLSQSFFAAGKAAQSITLMLAAGLIFQLRSISGM